MQPQTSAVRLNAEGLLESSKPQGQQSLLMPLFLLGVLVASLVSLRGSNPLLQGIVPLVFAGSIVVAVMHASRIAKRQQREKDGLRQVDEAVRLGNWDLAASAVRQLLGRPMMVPQARVQGLIYLGAVLVRQGQYLPAIKLYDHLLETVQFPPQIAMSLKCVRVYAMLREEHLSDAYQAIAHLKREAPGDSAMLQLLEMYRLVKTGHNADALELFGQRRVQLAAQLGHRSCDGWALAAAAAVATGQEHAADEYARNAGIMGNVREIVERFPECRAVLGRVWPAELQVGTP